MACICCGVVGDSEPTAPVDSTTRASLRRRLDLLPSIKIIADSAVAPPLESCRKRQKRETVVSTLPAPVNLELESNVRSGSKKVGSAVTNLVNNSNSVTEAESCFFSDVPKIGTPSICGRRRDMEDSVSIHPSFVQRNSENLYFHGVFDGHGCSHEEPVLVPNCDVENPNQELAVFNGNGESELEDFGTCVDEITDRVNQLEQKVVEVEHFYSTKDGAAQTNTSKSNSGGKKIAISQPNNSKCNSAGKEKTKGKHVSSPELMRQFGTMFRQIAQHKWAWPFLEPVDVKGLGLHDYYKVIEKPMDLGTVKKKMESSEYSNVREIYAEVRLVFKNAMRYNEEKEDVYVMAESLLEKLEEKWLTIMPKLIEEEKKQADGEAEERTNKQLTLEAAQAEMARDLSNELYEIDLQLERLRESVVQRCRKLSTQEKKGLSAALGRLSPEDLSKALKMVSESNPSFPAGAPEVELDIDVQTDVTLWRLKVFVQEALKAANKSSGGTNAQNNNNGGGEINKNNAKRRREISDAINKASIKRAKKA